MGSAFEYLIIGGGALAFVVFAIAVFLRRGRRYRFTKPGLVQRAADISEALSEFAHQRESRRRTSDAVLAGGGQHLRDHPDRYVSLYDESTRVIYRRDHLPEVKVLRQEFAKRGVREKALDEVYKSPDDTADVRTISTALLVMSQKLR